MAELKDTITITVEYYTGQDEEPPRPPYYVAYADEIGLVTDGDTLDELLKNIGEVLSMCLEETEMLAERHIAPHPRIMLSMELPEPYAKTA